MRSPGPRGRAAPSRGRIGPLVLLRSVLPVLVTVLAWRALVARDGGPAELSFASPAFARGGAIPERYTCLGADVSPPLAWGEAPPGTRSLALIVDGSDAPEAAGSRALWGHWVVYNIPPGATGLPEGASGPDLPAGTVQGLNDWMRTRYSGPCPGEGRHRYFYRLYALDTVFTDIGTPTRAVLEKAMQGHVLGQASLVGTYGRP